MDADDPTPAGEGAPPRARPAVRLAPKPARLGCGSRLGGDVAASRAPARVMRAATRLSAPRPARRARRPAGGRACRGRAPPPPAAPAPAAGGVGAAAGGMSAWEAEWIFGGDADKAIAMSENAVSSPTPPAVTRPRTPAGARSCSAAAGRGSSRGVRPRRLRRRTRRRPAAADPAEPTAAARAGRRRSCTRAGAALEGGAQPCRLGALGTGARARPTRASTLPRSCAARGRSRGASARRPPPPPTASARRPCGWCCAAGTAATACCAGAAAHAARQALRAGRRPHAHRWRGDRRATPGTRRPAPRTRRADRPPPDETGGSAARGG